MKTCRTCKETKTLDKFSFTNNTKKYYHTDCKPCRSSKMCYYTKTRKDSIRKETHNKECPSDVSGSYCKYCGIKL
jgi:hypothetical protein